MPLVARCLETIDVCIWRMFVSLVILTVYVLCLPVYTQLNYKYFN